MKSKIPLILFFTAFFFLPGCASAGGFFKGLFTFKAADKIQAAEKITGIEKANIKMADTAQLGSKNQANKIETKTTVGGNLNNDSEIMKEYIGALKDNSRQQGRLYQKVIMGLIVQLAGLISLLGWCLKFLLRADERRDIREEKIKKENV